MLKVKSKMLLAASISLRAMLEVGSGTKLFLVFLPNSTCLLLWERNYLAFRGLS